MKKQISSLLITSFVLALSSTAFADFNGELENSSNQASVSASILYGVTTTALVIVLAKQAVLNGQVPAMNVLAGGPATESFNDAKLAAQELLKVEFANDMEAAAAIVELGESFR